MIIDEPSTGEQIRRVCSVLLFILILHQSWLTALLSVAVQSSVDWRSSQDFDKSLCISSFPDKSLFTDQGMFEELSANYCTRKKSLISPLCPP